MNPDLSLREVQKEWHGTYKAYLIGFILSLILTSASFYLAISGWFSDNSLVYAIVALAIVQAIVQLVFFLHLGQEPKPKWESFVFYFMVLILLIIAIGTIWIMNDLNKRGMASMTKEDTHD